ncbi:uncharacterized protein FOMMEDRAFT_150244 [Fomitiporia mediterranea MF3/22]|uniref:uncharacterized protein n=1 Tax=Fomitiporia mediterranea (strain MF3/22) TaxID=694068 RepID=UPI0004408482|nr:uncharacterized protein FOMMEDRAFT_150244 [Fomitiporia mediterranea MF3/22]EJD07700.1 hypothetical protein FOMMEDRAFT_150244 [Fomitiporia mediterranea MF3/22]
MSSQSEEALKEEIARLSGAIQRHKTGNPSASSSRGNAYVNPNYKPPSRSAFTFRPNFASQNSTAPATQVPVQPREVLINGVAFQSSNRSLVRKDLVKPPSAPKPPSRQGRPPRQAYARKYPGSRAPQRPYKSKASRRFPQNNNMTLENGRKPVRVGRKTKSMKYIDKQCPRFSTTGVCTKGRTCSYKHDPSKIAVCWPFLSGSCPNTTESCPLSHDPIPERTPLCVHFANNGRCKNGADCLFPHVRVGPRSGVCRDFAVLGYCDKGIDCEHQHVRECPDFAEKGECPNPRCKLPHVIRANRRRADAAVTVAPSVPVEKVSEQSETVYGDNANIGDEYISLTFHESEESEGNHDDDDDSEEGESGEDEDADADADGDEDEENENDAGDEEDVVQVHV